MKKILLILIFSTAFVACNNQSADSSANDSVTSSIPDSISKQPVFVKDSLALSESEMKDDSVFVDGSKPSTWENAGIKDPIAFKRFLKRFQYWVINNDKEKVSSAIAFPLRNPVIKDKAEFLSKYDIFFNEKVKKALQHQNYNQIFRNVQGAMIGNGELWFTQKDNEFVVIAMNAN